MLIIEIRDNSIKLIQADSKVKAFSVKNAKVFDFEDSWKTFITNPENATALTDTIKSFGKETKALLCLNTTTVLYREMVVPKANARYLTTLIRHELSHALNLSSDFLIDYTILSETIKNEKKMWKILVTAVSAVSLNEIIEFFDKAGLTITKVDVSLNSIQKYVEITKLVDKEKTLLVADIGSSSIRQYLFEKGKYSVNRTTKVAALALDDEALSIQSTIETIEKMIQFSATSGQSPIDKIILFGSYPKIGHLKIALSDKLEVDATVMERPKILLPIKHKPFDHDEAYALGVLFSQRYKRTKDINLITAYNTHFSRSQSTVNFDAIFNSLAFGLAYVALFAVILLTLQTNMVNSDISKINAYLTRPDVVETLAKIDSMKGNIAALSELTKELDSIQKVLDSIPRFNDLKLIDLLTAKPEGIKVVLINFSDNTILVSIDANDPALIHQYVLALSDLTAFSEVSYTSYQWDTESKTYTSEISLTLNGEAQ